MGRVMIERKVRRINLGMNKVGNGHRLLEVGDLNGWVYDEGIDGITGAFGVPGVNGNGVNEP